MGFDAGDSNLYRYVNNSPTNATDPSGMDRYLFYVEGDPVWHYFVVVDNWVQNKETGLWSKNGFVRVDFAWTQGENCFTQTATLIQAATIGAGYRLKLTSDEDPKNMVSKAVALIGNANNSGLPALGIEQNTVLNRAMNNKIVALKASRKTSPAEDIGALRDVVRIGTGGWKGRPNTSYGNLYNFWWNNCGTFSRWVYDSDTAAQIHPDAKAVPGDVLVSIMKHLGPDSTFKQAFEYYQGLVRPPGDLMASPP